MKNNIELRGALDMILARMDSANSVEEWEIIRAHLAQCEAYALKCRTMRERLRETQAAHGAPATPLHRCAGEACPGLPFKASERPHPASCVKKVA